MSDPKEPPWLGIPQDPKVLRRILDNQANDIITSQTEQELRRLEIETIHEYSLKLLDGRLLDNQREREHQRSMNISSGMLVGFLSLLLAAGICYALYLNKDQLVMEFLKAILFIVTGGLGGYSLKLVRNKSETPKQ